MPANLYTYNPVTARYKVAKPPTDWDTIIGNIVFVILVGILATAIVTGVYWIYRVSSYNSVVHYPLREWNSITDTQDPSVNSNRIVTASWSVTGGTEVKAQTPQLFWELVESDETIYYWTEITGDSFRRAYTRKWLTYLNDGQTQLTYYDHYELSRCQFDRIEDNEIIAWGKDCNEEKHGGYATGERIRK